jgi:hypothetical protein
MAIGYSLRLLVYLLSLHSASVAVVWLTAVPVVIRIMVAIAIILNLAYLLLRDVFVMLPNSWRRIDLVQGGFRITTRNGAILSCFATGKIFVSPYFIVIRARIHDGDRSFARAICPDSMSAGSYRELCVYLKHG